MTNSYDRTNTEQGNMELSAIASGKAFHRVAADGTTTENVYDPVDLALTKILPLLNGVKRHLKCRLISS